MQGVGPYRHECMILPDGVDFETAIGLDEYVELSKRTDRMPESLEDPALGLFGEVGSLLTELKKKIRDSDSYVQFKGSLIEEMGDVLWYFSALVRRAGIPLSVIAQRAFRDIADWDEVEAGFGCFGDVQSQSKPVSREAFQKALLELAGKTGDLMTDLHNGKFRRNRDRLSGHLVEIFRSVILCAETADVDLEEVVSTNVTKIFSRWPLKRTYPPLIDERRSILEQLPRRIKITVEEIEVNGKKYVLQKCNGILLGDRLTDNKVEQDDYRFHDVFHLAYATFLGWSPVLRALFKVKRKSDPLLDENQDGARANLIEEGVATFLFGRGLERNCFEGVKKVDFDTLKAVREFTNGYEVDRCALWQWEQAILEGFKIFRFLREHRAGVITADLTNRTLVIARIPSTK